MSKSLLAFSLCITIVAAIIAIAIAIAAFLTISCRHVINCASSPFPLIGERWLEILKGPTAIWTSLPAYLQLCRSTIWQLSCNTIGFTRLQKHSSSFYLAAAIIMKLQSYFAPPPLPKGFTRDEAPFLMKWARAFSRVLFFGGNLVDFRDRLHTEYLVEFRMPQEAGEPDDQYRKRVRRRLAFLLRGITWGMRVLSLTRIESGLYRQRDPLSIHTVMPPNGPRPRPRPIGGKHGQVVRPFDPIPRVCKRKPAPTPTALEPSLSPPPTQGASAAEQNSPPPAPNAPTLLRTRQRSHPRRHRVVLPPRLIVG
ncbi:hypothetical protein BDZ89DRAFT_1150377 [Hymenopellis radicata]|nr:hypothetical protein BDZ89DRAFT_1150377 [Hymenopellis radicata]